jgi:hypothetical protein
MCKNFHKSGRNIRELIRVMLCYTCVIKNMLRNNLQLRCVVCKMNKMNKFGIICVNEVFQKLSLLLQEA